MYRLSLLVGICFALTTPSISSADETPNPLRVGIIGCDTSHVPSFAKAIIESSTEELNGLKLVAAFPGGSDDFPASRDRVAGYTKGLQDQGVQIVDSIEALLPLVDVVLLESVDGRKHLEQVRPVIAAKKPVFIDKPLAASLTDAIKILRLAEEAGVPCFSSSSLRFAPGITAIPKTPQLKKILGCDAYGPYKLAPHHPDMYWYGVHTVEMLYAVMGTGCESVARTSAAKDADVIVGVWKDGRVGVFRGIAKGRADFGVVVFGEKAVVPVSATSSYEPLMNEIAKFFKTGKPPVSSEVTLEMFAFMEAAHESSRQNGARIKLADIMAKAREQAK